MAIEAAREQETRWNVIGDGRIVNKIFLSLDDEQQTITTDRPRGREWQSTLEST